MIRHATSFTWCTKQLKTYLMTDVESFHSVDLMEHNSRQSYGPSLLMPFRRGLGASPGLQKGHQPCR